MAGIGTAAGGSEMSGSRESIGVAGGLELRNVPVRESIRAAVGVDRVAVKRIDEPERPHARFTPLLIFWIRVT